MGYLVSLCHHVSTCMMCGSMGARRATTRNALHLLGVQIVHAGNGGASARSCAHAWPHGIPCMGVCTDKNQIKVMRAILPAGPDPMPNRALKFEVLLVESGKDWNRLRHDRGVEV